MSQETETSLPQWAKDWMAAHPRDSTATKSLLASASANALPLAWSKNWVKKHLGASYGEEGAWANSSTALYFKAKRKKIYADYASGGLSASDQKVFVEQMRAYNVELARAIHPGLYDLGQRFLQDALTPADFKIAEFYLSRHPVLAGVTEGYTPEYTGFEGLSPIENYTKSQIYVAAKKGLIDYEIARRDLDQCVPEEIEQAHEDLMTFKDYTPPLPITGAAHAYPPGYPVGYPKELLGLAMAHSWGGFMTDAGWKHAISMFTVTKAMEILGQANAPKPGDAGYAPLPPLNDPNWQPMLTTRQ